MVEFNMIEHMGGASFVPQMGPTGFSRVLSPNRRPYRTKNGFACILPYTYKNWRDFFLMIDRKDLADDRRLVTTEGRTRFIDALYGEIAAAAPRHTTEEWVERCDQVSIPCMPLFGLDDLLDNPHLADVDFFSAEDHPTEGRYRSMRPPTTFSGSPFEVIRHAPRLGEHTEEVLLEAGVAPEAAASLATPLE